MGSYSPAKIVVLGAGPSGLCAAWNLVQNGHTVTVLEKEPVWGGQSITFERDGYKYDLGPHNIHSQRESVIRFLKNHLGSSFQEHKYAAQIYFMEKRINYPLQGVDVLRSINIPTALACGLSFFYSRLKSLRLPNFKDDGSYETWIVNRFGRKFYDIFFGPYSEKVWKIPPKELDSIVAEKRVALVGLVQLIHAAIFKKQSYHPENPLTIQNFYPVNGVGDICNFFADGIVRNGGKIITGANVEEIVTKGNTIERILYRHNGFLQTLDLTTGESPQESKVLSTIPVNEFVLMMEGNVPDRVKQDALGLDFTSEVFLYMNVKKPDVFKIPLLYFSEDYFPFNRVYDVGIFSRKMVPADKNALCFEISCTKGDELWNLDDAALFEKCMGPLEKHGLLNRSDVEAFHTRRLQHAYPRFRVGYKQKVKTIFEFLDSVENVFSFGREGLFSYANVDDAIWMGFEIAKNIATHDRMRLTTKEILPDYISF